MNITFHIRDKDTGGEDKTISLNDAHIQSLQAKFRQANPLTPLSHEQLSARPYYKNRSGSDQRFFWMKTPATTELGETIGNSDLFDRPDFLFMEHAHFPWSFFKQPSFEYWLGNTSFANPTLALTAILERGCDPSKWYAQQEWYADDPAPYFLISTDFEQTLLFLGYDYHDPKPEVKEMADA
jgi:hypothetical protein